MAQPKYFIGIDFGHGETAVSRTPGYNGAETSAIPLRNSGLHLDHKVMSSICRDWEGNWQLVWSENDFAKPDVREGFKDQIRRLDKDSREALREFAKLIFRTILNNDSDLKYDPVSGEANFVICIACPTGWRNEDPGIPSEYLRFFQKEAGITPVKMCINESDAALYTKMDTYEQGDTVLVIDLGSSTTDFTTYHDAVCIHDCCWNVPLGAHVIEEKVVEYGYTLADDAKVNVENMLRADKLRSDAELPQVGEGPVLLGARLQKEIFFTNHQDEYNFELKFRRLVPKWPDKSSAFSVMVPRENKENPQHGFYGIIADYINSLELALTEAVSRLSGRGIRPNRVLLSGGASRMPFVRDMAKRKFRDAAVYVDNEPDWVVSHGASRYIQFETDLETGTRKVIDDLNDWFNNEFTKVLGDTMISTIQRIVREILTKKLEQEYLSLEDTDDRTTLSNLKKILVSYLPNICDTSEFRVWTCAALLKELEEVVNPKIAKLIYDKFGKDIEVSGLVDNEIIKDIVEMQFITKESIERLPDTIHAILYNEFVTSLDRLFNNGLSWGAHRIRRQRKQAVKAIVDQFSIWTYNEEEEDREQGYRLMEEISRRCRELISRNRIFLISK